MTDTLLLSDYDLHLLAEGTHYRNYEKLGAHCVEADGVPGVHFAVWAPNASQVSVIGDFNGWSPDATPMVNRPEAGVWEAWVAGVGAGARYKYRVDGPGGVFHGDKADPCGFAAEIRPETASKVCRLEGYAWGDAAWMASAATTRLLDSPVSVYEVHLGSWRRAPEEGDRWLTYRELAEQLADYVHHMGFTHVELMPVTEHPFDGSWGYQTIGYFAPTSRFGEPKDFMHFVDTLHQRGIGVILDWVPAHFPRDGHGLGYFDGTHLYEHADPRQGHHPDWDTFIFNYGRPEVRNFLISNALFWLEEYHIDALRVDAVSSMLYLDYGREAGGWIPNRHGGRENLDAIDFLRLLNERVHGERPGVAVMAEESTSWPMVSKPTYLGGLGFSFKWNMGWMHDMLDYMAKDPVYRSYHHQLITFSMMYAFSENFILPFSHDEVVHGKGSMLQKMPGDEWQRFANLRLLYGFMFGHPGKKLLFMGCEFGQWREWNHDRSLDWHLLEQPHHLGLQRWVRDLNTCYRASPAMFETDFDPSGFAWIDCNDNQRSVVSFLRRGRDPEDVMLFGCNFTPVPQPNYRVGVPASGRWEEVLNSDATLYGGSGQGNMGGVESRAAADARPAGVAEHHPAAAVGGGLSRAARGRRPVSHGRASLGANHDGGTTAFEIWAPTTTNADVLIESGTPRTVRMERTEDGYFRAVVPAARPGTLYRFRLDGAGPFPDPASRFQPQGVHGPSQVVDPREFVWSDGAWRGVGPSQLVLYELHVGTFTPEGTFRAIVERLPYLQELGVTALQLMPVADFPGDRNWGYDGVALFAPARCYGTPDDLRAMVDAAHHAGLAVHLDVVYNHFGPDGAYQGTFSPQYVSRTHKTPWGETLNFDGPGSAPVRAYVAENAVRWVREYHLDGLRLDATHAIVDGSRPTIVAEISTAVHEAVPPSQRQVQVIAEDARNLRCMVEPVADGGWGADAVWSDDFHHQMRRAMAGDRDGYFADFGGTTAEIAATDAAGMVLSRAARALLRRGARHRPARHPLREVRLLPAEPRPGGQPRAGRPAAPGHRPGRLARRLHAAAAAAGDAAPLHGTGMGCEHPLPLLHRPQRRAGPAGDGGTATGIQPLRCVCECVGAGRDT